MVYPKELRALAKQAKLGLFCFDALGMTFSGPVKPEDAKFFSSIIQQIVAHRTSSKQRPTPLTQKLTKKQKAAAQSLFDEWGEHKDELSEVSDNLDKAEHALRALGIDPKAPPSWLK